MGFLADGREVGGTEEKATRDEAELEEGDTAERFAEVKRTPEVPAFALALMAAAASAAANIFLILFEFRLGFEAEAPPAEAALEATVLEWADPAPRRAFNGAAETGGTVAREGLEEKEEVEVIVGASALRVISLLEFREFFVITFGVGDGFCCCCCCCSGAVEEIC